MKILYSILFLFFSSLAFSQTKITGTVSDSLTGESLIGATVFIQDLNIGTTTDLDGNFSLVTKPGKLLLEVKYISYKNYKKEIVVSDITNIQILMSPDIQEMNIINIVSTVNKDSQTSLIETQKNSSTSVDGVTSDSFKKTPDSKASDVIKRISGASIQDGKFIVIRGLNDRYNFGTINGSTLPSSESDKRAFSFDIFPSNMIDNILIYKTANPDQSAEVTGGLITINTSEVKDKNFQYVQIGQSYNLLTTFKEFKSYGSSNLDYIGTGSNYRSLPNVLPSTQEFSSLNKDEKADLSKLIKNDWSTSNQIAPTNQSIQFLTNRFWKKRYYFGFVFGYNYQLVYNTNLLTRNEFEESETEVIKKMELRDSLFAQTVLHSSMLNFKFKFNDNNIIKLKNIYSINSDDKTNVRNGVRELDNDPRQWERSYNMWYTQNNLLTTQLIGEHKFRNSKLDWNIGFSDIEREVPNLRRIVYRKYSMNENDTTENYTAVIQRNGTIPTAAGNMFWSFSKENILTSKIDWTITLPIKKVKIDFKTGILSQNRYRNFESRNFGFSQYNPTGSTFDNSLLLLSPNTIFSPENLGLLESGKGGFKLEESTSVDDSYEANSKLFAGYIMTDINLTKELRITGGARVESYNQVFKYIEFGSNKQRIIDTINIDITPSVNLIYFLNEKYKVRFSYFKSLSRPEFRELAPFTFYNFIQDNILSGNPSLKRGIVENFDLRFEFYPRSNQIISISGFYKDFKDPIELINRTGTSGSSELYFTNVNSAKSYGGELEIRLKLLDNLTLYSNASIIKSVVDLHDIVGSEIDRPLQGQSPYIINSGIFLNNRKNDLSATISYNVIGPRIYIVGNVQEPSVWENRRNVIDFQLSKTFNNLEIKFNVKDILAQDLIYFQDLNGNRTFDSSDNNWQSIKFGQTYSVTAKFNF